MVEDSDDPRHTDGGKLSDQEKERQAEYPVSHEGASLPGVTETVPPEPDPPPPIDQIGIPVGDVRSAVIEEVKRFFHEYDETPLPEPSSSFIEDSFYEFDYPDQYFEIEHYWVNKPFAYVSIVYDEEQREYRYLVNEAVLDDFETYVRSDLNETLRDVLLYQDLDPNGDRKTIFDQRVTDLIAEYETNLEPGTLQKLKYYLTRDFVGYGEIDPLMRDSRIEDISCVGHELPVFIYHQHYRDLETSVSFPQERLNTFVTRLAQRSGKHISVADPLLDASLPDGSRIQLTLGTDVSTRGTNFTIRKFSEVPFTPVDLIEKGTMSTEMAAYLWLAIQNDISVLFAGGTASGKTTTMNAISFFIPPNSKVVSIEDTREIILPHDNWIQSVTREGTGDGEGIGMYKLLRAGLRQRPEYLLVGEIRTDPDVALTFFQAISTGHTGYSTFHADSFNTVIDRLTNAPLEVPAQMIRALDVIVVQRQAFQGSRRVRRVDEVVELTTGERADNLQGEPVYGWNPEHDAFEKEQSPKILEKVRKRRGWSEERLADEFNTRKRLLEYLVDAKRADHNAVSGVLQTFARDPETVTEELEAGTLDPQDYV